MNKLEKSATLAAITAMTPAAASAQVALADSVKIMPSSVEYAQSGRPAKNMEVVVEVARSSDGAITNCRVASDRWREPFASASCDLARRLSPAVMKGLKPAAKNKLTVSWQPAREGEELPDDGAPYVYFPGALSPNDYPLEAFRLRQQGAVAMKISVDADGMPISCDILESSHFPSLDETSCRITMRYARFIAPLDGQGTPRPSTSIKRINWRVP
jgi:TonB family protein